MARTMGSLINLHLLGVVPRTPSWNRVLCTHPASLPSGLGGAVRTPHAETGSLSWRKWQGQAWQRPQGEGTESQPPQRETCDLHETPPGAFP